MVSFSLELVTKARKIFPLKTAEVSYKKCAHFVDAVYPKFSEKNHSDILTKNSNLQVPKEKFTRESAQKGKTYLEDGEFWTFTVYFVKPGYKSINFFSIKAR